VGSVWLSPIYPTPDEDNGYDITDFKGVDAKFGTMQDFKDLLAALHQADIKLIMDFVPNHTSDQHEWFVKSAEGDPAYKDYYVWSDGTRAPNDWVNGNKKYF